VISFEVQAAAIATLLVERHGQWPILVGHSLGGPIAARIAADFPDKVRGLVILAGSIDPDLEMPDWYNFASTVPGIDLKMPANYQTSNAEIMAAPEQTRLLAAVLDRVRCPVQILHGTADKLVPVQNTDFAKGALANSPSVEVLLLPGEGHAIHRRCGPQVRAAIQRIADTAAERGR
jgi:pimeloyl-ACP methyl ester carboxylesterase